jgi:hypothetical protein
MTINTRDTQRTYAEAHLRAARHHGWSEDECKLVMNLANLGFSWCEIQIEGIEMFAFESKNTLTDREYLLAEIPVKVLSDKHGVSYTMKVGVNGKTVIGIPKFKEKEK